MNSRLEAMKKRLGKQKFDEIMEEFREHRPPETEYMARLRKKYPELTDGEVYAITFREDTT